MTLGRRIFLQLCAAAGSSRLSWAQAYPSRPVRILVGFAAGGTVDSFARMTAQWLSERTGQQVLVENRPGGAGNIAMEAAARSAPDGYTLILGHIGTLAVNPARVQESSGRSRSRFVMIRVSVACAIRSRLRPSRRSRRGP